VALPAKVCCEIIGQVTQLHFLYICSIMFVETTRSFLRFLHIKNKQLCGRLSQVEKKTRRLRLRDPDTSLDQVRHFNSLEISKHVRG
jgi:hypothetical protein